MSFHVSDTLQIIADTVAASVIGAIIGGFIGLWGAQRLERDREARARVQRLEDRANDRAWSEMLALADCERTQRELVIQLLARKKNYFMHQVHPESHEIPRELMLKLVSEGMRLGFLSKKVENEKLAHALKFLIDNPERIGSAKTAEELGALEQRDIQSRWIVQMQIDRELDELSAPHSSGDA